MNITIKESYMPEYTKAITFDYEGKEYLAEVYFSKHCSDYILYQGNKKLEDKPAWLEKAEEDPEFSFLFFIDEQAWFYEDKEREITRSAERLIQLAKEREGMR